MIKKMKKSLSILFLALSVYGCGCEQVDTGFRGIKTQFGKIQGEPLSEGLHWYNPLSESIKEIDVREHNINGEADSFTKDTQKVKITFVMTYYPDPTKIHLIYQNLGDKWMDKIVLPATLGAIKDTVGKYVADDLVGKREEAKDSAEREITETLKKRDVVVTRLDFTHLDFEDAYEKAVEDKVVAVQRAAEAKNKTIHVQETAKQTVIEAEAEAQSMLIRSQALSQNKNLVEYEAVQKWDGKLPTYMMGNSTPFIKLGGK